MGWKKFKRKAKGAVKSVGRKVAGKFGLDEVYDDIFGPPKDEHPPGEYNDIKLASAWRQHIERLGDYDPIYSRTRDTDEQYDKYVEGRESSDALIRAQADLTPSLSEKTPLVSDLNISI